MPESTRVALITGAAQGIGREISLRLADDGFDVAVNDMPSKNDNLTRVAQEIRSKGRRAFEVLADVSSEEQVKGMVESTVKELGGLDVMVANAGIVQVKPLVDITVEDWEQLYSINVRGVFLCYKYAARQMIGQGRGGRIIGASSIAGKKGSARMAAYCSSKFAVRGLTQSAASELGKHGITVNAYVPGAISTPMLQTLDELAGTQPGQLVKMMKDMTAVGYNGTPKEVASLVSFLSSKESHFITGQSVRPARLHLTLKNSQ